MRTSTMLSLFIYLFIATGANAQCNCKAEFSFLRSYIERNYPGFADKTPTYGGLHYNKFTELYEQKVIREHNNAYCMALMESWMGYFKDHHLGVEDTVDGADTAVLNARIHNTERMTITPAMLKQLQKSKGVEGIYYRYDSTFKVAVIKSADSWRSYAAVVLETKNSNWAAGMVKFALAEKNGSAAGKDVYACVFYFDDHSFGTKKFSFSGFDLDDGKWKKESREETQNDKKGSVENSGKEHVSPLEFRMAAKDCAYMRISSFNGNLIDRVDSMIAHNDHIISSTPNLIIDIRNNGGGADRTYRNLLPYLYTQPVTFVGVSMFATKDNIEAERFLTRLLTQEEIKETLRKSTEKMMLYEGKFIPPETDTMTMDSVKRYPEKIVVLVNGECASSAEEFLLVARQSRKVTIMGQHTDGTLDYSNRRPVKFPCIPYILAYPISRSGRLPQNPIDNIGVQPNVVLKDDKSWEAEALEFLKK